MLHIDDDGGDEDVDHCWLEVQEDRVKRMRMMVAFVERMEEVVSNLMDVGFLPSHSLIVDVDVDL